MVPPPSLLVVPLLLSTVAAAAELSVRMVHRFSDEAMAAAGGGAGWPRKGSGEYCAALARSDLQRQKHRLSVAGVGNKHGFLFPAAGSDVIGLGNDFGWLHYTWIDIGTPNVSFLVALDSGSDLLWVPCNCVQCYSLSSYHGSFDKELGVYNPDESKTSRHLPCSHTLCAMTSSCTSPKQPCPYSVQYYSENTTSSGLLLEDTLHLGSTVGHSQVQASIIIGCGKSQSGQYLDGIAPDGLLGLGFGDLSVPSSLSREGLVRNSFSMCFKEDDSGRILFGDQGVPTQQSTPFVTLNGNFSTYAIAIENICVGLKCLEGTGLHALVDSGSSFTYLPNEAYQKFSSEFDRQANASRVHYDISPFEYCYNASPLALPELPTLTLTIAVNKSFLAISPVFQFYEQGELSAVCLAVQPFSASVGIIGQNFLIGYSIVFDRENMNLGWYRSNCHETDSSTKLPLSPSQENRPEDPLPTDEQQNPPNGNSVTPAVAGRGTTSRGMGALPKLVTCHHLLILLITFTTIFVG